MSEQAGSAAPGAGAAKGKIDFGKNLFLFV
jgi:hypothetical protein